MLLFLYPFTSVRNKKVVQSVSCKRSQVLQMCVIRVTSYSLLCWSPRSRADAVPGNAYLFLSLLIAFVGSDSNQKCSFKLLAVYFGIIKGLTLPHLPEYLSLSNIANLPEGLGFISFCPPCPVKYKACLPGSAKRNKIKPFACFAVLR